jgi:hypothetical protein
MDNQILNEKHQPRRSSFSNDPTLALEVDLEKEWDNNLERTRTDSSSSIHEPEKARTRTVEEDDAVSSHHDLEGGPVVRTVTAQDWTGPDDPEVSFSTLDITPLRLTT